jgi:hypothetical protein
LVVPFFALEHYYQLRRHQPACMTHRGLARLRKGNPQRQGSWIGLRQVSEAGVLTGAAVVRDRVKDEIIRLADCDDVSTVRSHPLK